MLVSSIISAASRKVKSRHRRSGEDIECEWSSREIERSRDGGERLRESTIDKLREVDRLRDSVEKVTREAESSSQRSSHSDIAMSIDTTPKSSRSMSKTSCHSTDSVAGALHNSLQDTYSNVRLRKDNARSSLDSELFGNSNSNIVPCKDRSNVYDNGRTSMPVNASSGDSSSMLVSSLGCSTPNMLNTSDPGRTTSSRPMSTYESSSGLLGLNARPIYSDGIAIRSYRDLTANTQERIRRFEEETRAMLDRDTSKQRRLSSRLEFDRQTIEDAWQKAKKDLEEEDLLDLMADNPSGKLLQPINLVKLNDYLMLMLLFLSKLHASYMFPNKCIII